MGKDERFNVSIFHVASNFFPRRKYEKNKNYDEKNLKMRLAIKIKLAHAERISIME